MTNYSLTLQIAAADLPTLQAAGEQIVLVRRLANAGRTVAWAVLPLMQSRVVTWNDDYGLFASNTPNVSGNVISSAAAASAVLQCDYTFSMSGFQGPVPDPALGPSTVQIRNNVPASSAASILMGLSQAYAVDGGGAGTAQPLNAQTVPALQIAQFNASQELWVYLASGISTGMIVPQPVSASNQAKPVNSKQVFSAALLLKFGAGSASQTAQYSATLGRFYAST